MAFVGGTGCPSLRRGRRANARPSTLLDARPPLSQVPSRSARLRRHVTSCAASNDELGPLEEDKPKPLSTAEWAQVWFENIREKYILKKEDENAPTASGDVSELEGAAFPLLLFKYFKELGSMYVLAFGPKKFYVVSDPVMARHLLRERSINYDKGLLADILEGIMGKGLIPADFETWKKRRRAIAPAFHPAFLDRMIATFTECSLRARDRFWERIVANGGQQSDVINMEAEYSSLALDIIGKAVFNYDFNSVTSESPVIQAVYRMLQEAEWRSRTLVPIWNVEPLNWIVPRLRAFRRDQKLLNDTLDELIAQAIDTKSEADEEQLQRRDYRNSKDPSVLRYLVDLRGEQATCKQLRDDLMTMLIAGHETTAALLTWSTYLLAQHPQIVRRLEDEVDEVLGEREAPTWKDLKRLRLMRMVLAEALRLYPQPPLLIRRALKDDVLPQGGSRGPVQVKRGSDIFISVWNLHRSAQLWERPEEFDPDRWSRSYSNEEVVKWKGRRPVPDEVLYPNEITSDFAFLPFGGGSRKCVGDQFAMLESLVGLATIMRNFTFELVDKPEDVKFVTGATIHTANGLNVRLRPRRHHDRTNGATNGVHASSEVAQKEAARREGNGSVNVGRSGDAARREASSDTARA